MKAKAKKGQWHRIQIDFSLPIKFIPTKTIDILWIINYSLIGRDLDDEDSEDDDESSEEEMPKSKVTRNITL